MGYTGDSIYYIVKDEGLQTFGGWDREGGVKKCGSALFVWPYEEK